MTRVIQIQIVNLIVNPIHQIRQIQAQEIRNQKKVKDQVKIKKINIENHENPVWKEVLITSLCFRLLFYFDIIFLQDNMLSRNSSNHERSCFFLIDSNR